MHSPHLLEFGSDKIVCDLCAAHCDTDGDVAAACDVNLGVGGPDDRGDLIDAVEIDEGLDAGVFRKTRAGGNWLTGGIVMRWRGVVAVARLYGSRGLM